MLSKPKNVDVLKDHITTNYEIRNKGFLVLGGVKKQ